MRPHEVKNIYRAGAFVALLLLLVITVTFMLSKERSIFDQRMFLFTNLNNAQGLKQGAAVKLKGIKIGSVKSIQFETLEKIQVKLDLSSKSSKWIKRDSFISIKTQGMLGDKYIEILGGSENSPSVRHKDTIETEDSREIKDFIVKGENILITANRVLTKLDFVLDDLTSERKLKTTVENLLTMSDQMKKLFSPVMVKNAKTMVSSMAGIGERIEKGPGNIHSLIYDKSIYQDLQTLLGGAQRNKVIKYFIRESINKSEEISE